MFITFLTDFGLEDDFVGTCHGVIKQIAPEAEVIDITHGIGPQTTAAARRSGAHVAAQARTQDLAGLVAAVREAAG